MGKRITDQELEKIILDKCNEKGLIYSRFEKTNKYFNVYLTCFSCGREYSLQYRHLMNSKVSTKLCHECENNLFYKNFYDRCDELGITYLGEDLDKNLNLNQKDRRNRFVRLRCSEGHEYSTRVRSIVDSTRNGGCFLCGRKLVGEKSRLDEKTAIERLAPLLSLNYKFLGWIGGEWKGTHNTKVSLICPEGHKYTPNYGTLIKDNTRCPLCTTLSHLEEEIYLLFKSNSVNNFVSQFSDNWLKNISYLKLDFYIPDYNIAIECQGEQHFRPINWFGGEETFKSQRERDLLKYNLCKEHGITILYYTNVPKSKINFFAPVYTDINELLNEIKKYIN